jgi:hypothetical protein
MVIVIMILQGIGIIIGVCILYLLAVALSPGFTVPKQSLEKTKQAIRKPDTKPS